MSRHSRFQEMLARRTELAPVEEERLQDHMQGCPECREIWAAYQRQTTLLRALPTVEAPAALRARVLAGIRTPQPARRPFAPLAMLAAPVAAALIVIVGALVYLDRPHRSGPKYLAQPAPSATSRPYVVQPPRVSPAPSHPTTRVQRPTRPKAATRAHPPVHRHTHRRAPSTPAPVGPPPFAQAPVLSQAIPTPVPQPATSAPFGAVAAAPAPAAPTRTVARAQPGLAASRPIAPRPSRVPAARAAAPPSAAPAPTPAPPPPNPPTPVSTPAPAATAPVQIGAGRPRPTPPASSGVSVSAAPLPAPILLPTPNAPPQQAVQSPTPLPTPTP